MAFCRPDMDNLWTLLDTFLASKIQFPVDTVEMACRQSKIRDCRDTVDDRVSTTALTFADMNYFLPFLVQYRQSTEYRQSTDRQTESNAYEPTVQVAQVGSKIGLKIGGGGVSRGLSLVL